MKRIAVAAVAVALIASACGEGDEPHAGRIVDKRHEAETSSVLMMPIQISQSCTKAGSVTTCTPIYGVFPFIVTDDEDWVLEVAWDDNGEQKTGSMYVARETYDALGVGDWFDPETHAASTDDPDSKRRKS